VPPEDVVIAITVEVAAADDRPVGGDLAIEAVGR